MSEPGKTQKAKCGPVGQNDQWEFLRVVYNLNDGGAVPFAQSSVFTRLFEGVAQGGGPDMAVVDLHSIASTRTIIVPSPQITDLFTPDLLPPTANSSSALPPLVDTVQRGGTPQWRITFQGGGPVASKVYCDGNSVLALPARKVLIDIMTPTLLSDQTRDPTIDVPAGLIVEALAEAHVTWGVNNGVGAPMGPVNYTQGAHTVNPVEPMFFEVPPYARRVTVIPPILSGALISFMASPGLAIATPPPIANTIQRSQPIPGFATHVRLLFPVGTPASLLALCIWEIGV